MAARRLSEHRKESKRWWARTKATISYDLFCKRLAHRLERRVARLQIRDEIDALTDL